MIKLNQSLVTKLITNYLRILFVVVTAVVFSLSMTVKSPLLFRKHFHNFHTPALFDSSFVI
jgi:hypothetical protein